eukprot:5949728-Amphidinium_carterae.1
MQQTMLASFGERRPLVKTRRGEQWETMGRTVRTRNIVAKSHVIAWTSAHGEGGIFSLRSALAPAVFA